MPINQLAPYRLTKVQRKALEDYLTGKAGINKTAATYGTSRQHLYTVVAVIMRHAASTGEIDAKQLLKKY